jgi:hypothetical protein
MKDLYLRHKYNNETNALVFSNEIGIRRNKIRTYLGMDRGRILHLINIISYSRHKQTWGICWPYVRPSYINLLVNWEGWGKGASYTKNLFSKLGRLEGDDGSSASYNYLGNDLLVNWEGWRAIFKRNTRSVQGDPIYIYILGYPEVLNTLNCY